MKAYKICVLFLIILLQGCDPREIDLPAWESEVLLPLINADFSISDIVLNEDLKLKEDSSGALSIVYLSHRDSFRLKDYLEIPDKKVDFKLPGIPNGIDDFEFEAGISAQELELPEGSNVYVPPFHVEEITDAADISEYFIEALFESGEIALTVENGFPFSIDAGLKIEIINSDDGSVVVSHVAASSLAAKSEYTIAPLASLAGKRIGNKLEVVVSNISSDGTSEGTITAGDRLGFRLSLTDLRLAKATLVIPPFAAQTQQYATSFVLPYGAKLTAIHISDGNIKAVMDQTTNFPVALDITFNSAMQDGQPLQESIDMETDQRVDIALEGTEIDMSNGGQALANTIAFSFSISSPGSNGPVTVDFSQPLSGSLEISNIRPSAVFGYLGSYEHLLNGGLEVDFFDHVVSGTINFSSPTVTAYVHNELGTGVSLIDNNDLYVRGTNSKLHPGVAVLIRNSLKQVSVAPAHTPGHNQLSKIELNEDNEPNFDDFLSLLPSEIVFSFPVRIGTAQEDLSQFALDTSIVSGYIETEFPLNFEANELTFTDTLDLDVAFENSYSEVLSGDLITVATNMLPVELLLQVYFMDDEKNVLDSLFVERRLITAGEVDEQGRVIRPSEVKFVITLDNDAVEHLNMASYAQPVFVLNTSGEQKVKIFSDSRVNLKMNGDFRVVLKNE
ncbi:hypothetical protein C900_04892 [Fulvivirga imtechensis AK7]|uniref:Uncharacterized protein n=1 Tax=Fulvivirga imtechensis AK7 TaxID=1237149 RepID=L8JQL4_9BACT|nr:hypothetical protein [Fulvivirga imtechensis]ELR69667.1 hypothetical protein C900_04892 [Fulvivirga imtechensis AK7]